MADMNAPGWMQAKLTEEFTRQGLRIAEQLRRTAEEVERAARNVSTELDTGLPDHNQSVADILKAINGFHGNLSTHGLLTAAAEADRHARNPENS
jgi:hypothetical protein